MYYRLPSVCGSSEHKLNETYVSVCDAKQKNGKFNVNANCVLNNGKGARKAFPKAIAMEAGGEPGVFLNSASAQ